MFTYLGHQRVARFVEGRVIVRERVDGHEKHGHDGLGRGGHRVQYGVVDALRGQRIVERQENHVISCGIQSVFSYIYILLEKNVFRAYTLGYDK